MTDEFENDEPEPVVLPIEHSIDLHTFAPRDIPDVVEAYLEAAREAGFTEVRIIHGKGKGVHKERGAIRFRLGFVNHAALSEHAPFLARLRERKEFGELMEPARVRWQVLVEWERKRRAAEPREPR